MQQQTQKIKQISQHNVQENAGQKAYREHHDISPEFQMQQTIGNHGVLRRLALPVQPKLKVNEPDDLYEREADRVSDRVMCMPEPAVQRQAEDKEEEDEEPIQTKPVSGIAMMVQRQTEDEEEGEETTPLQTKTSGQQSPQINRGLESQIQSIRGSGQPLSAAGRAFFEPRFGHDFSDVRLHTDTYSADTARAINSRAFTVGKDILFGAKQYVSGTDAGRRLLAHELTHVVQQNNQIKPAIQRKIQVGSGLEMDTLGYTTSKSGDTYNCPKVVKDTIWHELFTSLLHSPRVFKLKGTTNTEVNKNFKKHQEARYGILEFASKKRYTFGAGADFKMNPKYWIVDADGYSLKPGADPEKAIKDLNVHPEKYSIACWAATALTMTGGSMSELVEDNGVGTTDWIPGDWGYITNTSFPPGGTPGLEGENIIYTGKNKFWGHFGPGNTYKTLTAWFNTVKSWHGSANTENHRTRPGAGLE